MSVLDWLFKSRVQPLTAIDAGVLGALNWSIDDESWRGVFNGVEFFVFRDEPSDTQPGKALSYAESILTSLDWLKDAVEKEKSKYASKHPKFAAELQSLGIESLAFSIHKKKGRHLNCQLGYGSPDRFWSLGFHDRKCSGIGFDS
jgi:hypothetical protein